MTVCPFLDNKKIKELIALFLKYLFFRKEYEEINSRPSCGTYLYVNLNILHLRLLFSF